MTLRLPLLVVVGLLALGGVNAWLLAIVVDEMTADHRAAIDKVDWDPEVTGSTESAATRRPIGAYGDTLARPVFFKTRTPYVPPPPPPPPAPPKVVAPPPPVVDPGFVVGGVVIETPLRKAYVFTRANPQGTWAKEGEDVMGWKVQSVNSSGVVLHQQGRTIELKLYPTP